MKEIPRILQGKIFEERFDPDIFAIYRTKKYSDRKFYEQGSITFKGNTQKCFFLTGTWNEYAAQNGPPVKAQSVTNGIDFSTVIIAKSKGEAIDKILNMIKNHYVSKDKKEYILYPAYWQLQAKARGVQQEPWKRKATALAVSLYKWLSTEILNKNESQRYPPINSELRNLGLPKIQWRRADTVKKLTYALVKQQYPELSAAQTTFDKHYIHNAEQGSILSLYDDEFSWIGLANKLFHKNEPFLWYLFYKHDLEILVIKRPDDQQIRKKEPLKCSFEVYRGGEIWDIMELTFKRDEEGGFYNWWDTD